MLTLKMKMILKMKTNLLFNFSDADIRVCLFYKNGTVFGCVVFFVYTGTFCVFAATEGTQFFFTLFPNCVRPLALGFAAWLVQELVHLPQQEPVAFHSSLFLIISELRSKILTLTSSYSVTTRPNKQA